MNRKMPESPRWLMTQGRITETKKHLNKAAKLNGAASVDVDQLVDQCWMEYTKEKKLAEERVLENYTILDLLRTPNMRKKSLIMFYSWFVASMVYYGLLMGVTDLAGDPYLNLVLSGIAEVAAIVFTMFIVDRIGRRSTVSIAMFVGGVTCVICGLLPPKNVILIIVFNMVGKFGLSAAFGTVYVYAAEIFPTVVRTLGVGGSSMCARAGGLLAPFVAELRHVWSPLPIIVFGVMSISAGGLSLLLPETLEQKLPETLEEGEHFGRNDYIRCRIHTKKEAERANNIPEIECLTKVAL